MCRWEFSSQATQLASSEYNPRDFGRSIDVQNSMLLICIPLPSSARNLELVALRTRLVIEGSHFAEVFVHSLAAGEAAVLLAGEGTAHSLAGVLAARSPAEIVDRRLAARNLAAADMLYAARNLAAADMLYAGHNHAAVVAAVAGTYNSDRILDLVEVHRTAAHPKVENSARLSCRKMNRSPPSVT